jgi:hypothetical protein
MQHYKGKDPYICNSYDVIIAHSAYALPADLRCQIGGGSSTWEGAVERQLEWDSKHPVYTYGHEGDPDHLWEIIDFSVSETVRDGKYHSFKGCVVFYYQPVNDKAILRDCFPEWLDENGELLPEYR